MKFKNSLLGSATIYTIANIINASIPFLLLPILTRVLNPADYGTLTMFATVLTVMGAFTGLNSHAALSIRYFQQDQFELPAYISTCLAILLGSMALFMVIIIFSVNWLARYTQVPAKWLIIAFVVSGAQFVIQILLYLWRAANQPLKYAVIQVCQSACNAALSLWLLLGLGWAWQGRTAGQSIAALLCAVFALVFLWKAGWIKGAPRSNYAWDALKFGMPLIPHVIGAMFITMADRVIITNLLDIGKTGIYMVGMQIGMVVGLLTDSFNKSFGPWLFGTLGEADEAKKITIVRYTYTYFLILSLLAILLGLLAQMLLGILVGEKFRQASGIVIYIAVGFAFGGMYLMVTNYIFYMSKTYYLAIITIICGIFNVGLSYFLIKHYALHGAGVGFMISQAVFFFATWFLAHKVYPMPWKIAIFSR